jgi:hypothetical protein
MKKLATFFQWAFIIILLGTGLLTTWLAIANIIVVQQEKKIEQEIEAFAREFPPTDFNQTANQLRQLTPKLGFKLFDISRQVNSQFSQEELNLEVTEKNRQDWEKIYPILEAYLQKQFSTGDDSISPPPKELQDYLTKHSATIAAIRDIILSQPNPTWRTDITPNIKLGNGFQSFDYFGLINVQKIIALDILEKQRQGETQAALEMLEVSYKLTEHLQNHLFFSRPRSYSYFLEQGYLYAAIRKLDNLPDIWKYRLGKQDYRYRQSGYILNKAEIMGIFSVVVNTDRSGLDIWEELGTELSESIIILNRLKLNRVKSLYLRLGMIKMYQSDMRSLEKLQAQEYNVCQSDRIEFEAKLPPWWNPIVQMIEPRYNPAIPPPRTFFLTFDSYYIIQASKYMLDLELTQKILQVKAQAAKVGKWPETVDNLESDICPGFTWVYQVAEDGTMSLSLSQEPDWQADRLENNRGLPLTYRDRTISQSKPSAN